MWLFQAICLWLLLPSLHLLAQSTAPGSPSDQQPSAWPTKIPANLDKLPDDMAPPVPTPIEIAPGTLLLEDFSTYPSGVFPAGWKLKGNNENPRSFYNVTDGEGGKYLKADAVFDGGSIFRKVDWDLEKYPILEWRWRARVLPKEGDEKRGSKNDCAVAIYVVFPVRWFLPDSLKYTWSTTLPAGVEFSNGRGRNKIHVLRSGEGELNQWVVERRNVYEDFKRRFDRTPPKPIALGIITDADDTQSSSSGDYGFFKISTESGATPTSTPKGAKTP